MKSIIENCKKAGNEYLFVENKQIENTLIDYIKLRISENKGTIEKLLKITKEPVVFENIIELFDCYEVNEYRNYKNTEFDEEKVKFNMFVPIGVICVECDDVYDIVECIVNTIITRNAIVISDKKYSKYSVKNLIMLIVKEAFKKFNINENIIMHCSFEECDYSLFDKVILLNGEVQNYKKESGERFVYIENCEYADEVIKNDNTEFLYGNIDDAIKKINKNFSEVAVIYTKNPQLAYKFIYEVKSKNVFVNTNVKNVENVEDSKSDYYYYENVVIPSPMKNIVDCDFYEEYEQNEVDFSNSEVNNEELVEKNIINNTSIIDVKVQSKEVVAFEEKVTDVAKVEEQNKEVAVFEQKNKHILCVNDEKDMMCYNEDNLNLPSFIERRNKERQFEKKCKQEDSRQNTEENIKEQMSSNLSIEVYKKRSFFAKIKEKFNSFFSN